MLRGAGVVALAAGIFNATLSNGVAAERAVVPRLAVGLSWSAAEEDQWKGLRMYFPPTVVVRGDDAPLLVMGLYEGPGYDKTLPSFTIWADGITDLLGDDYEDTWAKPLGGSCVDGDGMTITRRDGLAASPVDGYTCRIAPASQRDTADLLPYFPEDLLAYDPIVIELTNPHRGFHDSVSGEGVRYHSVGIDLYGGAGKDDFRRYRQRPITALPVATAATASTGVVSTYQRGLSGSEAQSTVGFRGTVQLGVGYDYTWEDAYLKDVTNGQAVRSADLLLFYGSDQSESAWIASWSEGRRSRDAARTVLDAIGIALLGGFVAYFVGATPQKRGRRVAAGATSLLSRTRSRGSGASRGT